MNLPKIDTLFSLFLKTLKSELLIRDLISRLIEYQNDILIHQNLSMRIDNQKQIKFGKEK